MLDITYCLRYIYYTWNFMSWFYFGLTMNSDHYIDHHGKYGTYSTLWPSWKSLMFFNKLVFALRTFTVWTKFWVVSSNTGVSRADVDVVMRRNLTPCQESNPSCPVHTQQIFLNKITNHGHITAQSVTWHANWMTSFIQSQWHLSILITAAVSFHHGNEAN